MQTSEMKLQQLFFVYTAFQISFCAEIGLENLRQQTSNSSLTSESPQHSEGDLDDLMGIVSETSKPTAVAPDCKCVPYYLCSTRGTIIDARLEQGPCENYLDICCNEATDSADQIFTPKRVVRRSNCGQRNIHGVGFESSTSSEDTESKFGEFPWMVAILQAEQDVNKTSLDVYQCGGSLIHRQVVLTAAHCVVGKDVKTLKARAGEWDAQTDYEIFPHHDRNVKEIVVHENFNAGELHNDIALLIMESPFEIAENVDLICLPDEGEIMDGRQCVASGWGNGVFGKNGRYHPIMSKVELPIVPRESCVEALRKTSKGQFFQLHESFICAGGESGKGACEGDLGNPLVCLSRDDSYIYRQAGLVSWGIDCGKANPGVYVNVPLFKGWITSKLSFYNVSF